MTESKNSYGRCSMKKAVPKNFAIFKRKHLGWSLSLKKVQVFRAATLLKNDSITRIFLWNLQNLEKHLVLKNIFKRSFLRVLRPASCHWSLSIPPESISLTYFQWVYKEASAIEWVNIPLYKNSNICWPFRWSDA